VFINKITESIKLKHCTKQQVMPEIAQTEHSTSVLAQHAILHVTLMLVA